MTNPAPDACPAVDADVSAETMVTRIWTELGLHPTSLDDDFFDLGGQSLTLVRFLVMVQERYDVELPVDRLFEADLTVAAAAAAIRQGQLAALDDDDLAEALAELDGLSDQEVAELIGDHG